MKHYTDGLSPAQIFDAMKGNKKRPSLRSIATIVSEAKVVQKESEYQDLEQPWHTGKLRELSPPAIAKIFEIKVKLGWDDITVREAKWLNRLSALPLSLEALKYNSQMYAFYERLSNLVGITFDSDAAERDNKVLMAMLRSEDGGKSLAESALRGADALLSEAYKDGEA